MQGFWSVSSSHNSTIVRSFIKLTLAAMVAILVGLATSGAAYAQDAQSDRATIRSLAGPEMRAWARASVPATGSLAARLDRLRAALARRLGPDDPAARTLHPIEAFDRGGGNCVSFALLFTALARSIGVPTQLAIVDPELTSYVRGSTRVNELHMVATLVTGGQLLAYDRAGRLRAAVTRPLQDHAALAILQSNLGTEQLLAGNLAEAIRRLRAAVTIDPESAIAWVNLGAALSRGGEIDQAAKAYRRAIQLDPTLSVARRNLVSMENRTSRGPEPQ